MKEKLRSLAKSFTFGARTRLRHGPNSASRSWHGKAAESEKFREVSAWAQTLLALVAPSPTSASLGLTVGGVGASASGSAAASAGASAAGAAAGAAAPTTCWEWLQWRCLCGGARSRGESEHRDCHGSCTDFRGSGDSGHDSSSYRSRTGCEIGCSGGTIEFVGELRVKECELDELPAGKEATIEHWRAFVHLLQARVGDFQRFVRDRLAALGGEFRTVNEEQLARALRGELAPEDVMRPSGAWLADAEGKEEAGTVHLEAGRHGGGRGRGGVADACYGHNEGLIPAVAVPLGEPKSSWGAGGAGGVPVVTPDPKVEADAAQELGDTAAVEVVDAVDAQVESGPLDMENGGVVPPVPPVPPGGADVPGT
ncbi:hypothetical protein CYMTET_28881 [Cymbomonas tetramitiformis]|uniref:Uncharacterized protein n=1 Tax=Cymbomonas tetramitiformis TaxID=36881 RepID=A0AAE0FNK0_9CHLO|nr:hypothetical protein CYMTET_28881 [Cymbomonas tetramitiformis]